MEERIHNLERILDHEMPGEDAGPPHTARPEAAEGGR
jgi:hypothetical protein